MVDILGRIQRPKVLLHSCCGPCSSAVIERLSEDYQVCILYYNPCITDEEEYQLRKENQILFIDKFNENNPNLNIEYFEGDYEPSEYLSLVKGLEAEPEGGARCTLCFKQRLSYCAKIAKEKAFDYFATTLTVSPHKNYPLISKIGNEISQIEGIGFLDMDFKKKAGFQRSIQLSKEYGLYRQDYCGCDFSKR